VSSEFTIKLEEVFMGPMDLLLHLVREQEVEIHEVEISRVIVGYFDYLKSLESMDIEVAGEFLVMAATLMAIKSRSLLPREEVELEDELDPGDELIQRLIEYRRFKAASEDLEYRRTQRLLEHRRGYRHEVRDNEPERSYEIGELTAWDLLSAFSRLMRETMASRTHHVKGDPRPLRWFVRTVAQAISRKKKMTLPDIVKELGDEPTREGLIGAFCALLELVKLGVVRVRQDAQDEDISLIFNEEAGDDIEAMIGASRLMDEDDEEEERKRDASEAERLEAEQPEAEQPEAEQPEAEQPEAEDWEESDLDSAEIELDPAAKPLPGPQDESDQRDDDHEPETTSISSDAAAE
jgi:segregation and condensation protein A